MRTPIPASNRCGVKERSAQHELPLDRFLGSDFGVDYLQIGFPIAEMPQHNRPSVEAWQERRNGVTVKKEHLHLGFGDRRLDLFLYERAGQSPWCTLHLNPARFVD